MSKLNQNSNTVNPPEADEDNSSIRPARKDGGTITRAQLIHVAQDLLQRPIAFHRIFARIGGGVTAGLMLSQAWYWTPRAKNAEKWFYKSQLEWEEETGLTRREQETARRNLKERGLIEEKLAGVPATLHFRVNVEKFFEALCPEQQSSLAETCKLDCTEQPSKFGGNVETTSETSSETSSETTHTQHLRAVGAVAVCGGSRFTIEECRRYAKHLQSTGQGIKNPGGYATSIHRTGKADVLIEEFLNRTPEQVEEIRITPANQNLFFGEAVQLLQAMMAVGREPQAIIDDMPLDDDTRRRLIEKFIKVQPHGLKASDNLRNTPGPEFKPAEYKHEQLLNPPAVERHQSAS